MRPAGGGHTARDGETGRTAAPAQPIALDAPPNQTHTPWGAFSSSPRAHPHSHASALTRARPRPAARAPSPFSLPRSCPRGPTEDSPFLNTPCAAPQSWRRRDRGCADAEAAGGRWGSCRERAAFSPLAPTFRGASACRDRRGERRATATTCQQCGCGAAHAVSRGQSGTSLPARPDGHVPGCGRPRRPATSQAPWWLLVYNQHLGWGEAGGDGARCDSARTLRPDPSRQRLPLPLACPWVCHLSPKCLSFPFC